MVDSERFAAGDSLEGLVDWFWSVQWDLPVGITHDQRVLNHPAGNISIGTLDDAGVAAVAEHDRTVCRAEQLAEAAGVSVRTLQLLFGRHVGVSPTLVIRRWRVIEAAGAARSASDRGESWKGWAALATELGYADQAHLTRDFRRHFGTTPSAYLARVRDQATP